MLNDRYARYKELLNVYQDQVIYSIATDTNQQLELKIGAHNKQLDQLMATKLAVNDGYIITAYNPRGQKQAQEKNEVAHRNLTSYLKGNQNLVYLPSCSFEVSSGAATGHWVEPGYAIFGLSAQEARELAQRFNQLAIVGLHSGQAPVLIPTGD